MICGSLLPSKLLVSETTYLQAPSNREFQPWFDAYFVLVLSLHKIQNLLFLQIRPFRAKHYLTWYHDGLHFGHAKTEKKIIFRKSDRILILVTSFGCWCPTSMLKDRGCWWRKRPKPSPTSQSCHQHISSPTSVTNIDVVEKFHNIYLLENKLLIDDRRATWNF